MKVGLGLLHVVGGINVASRWGCVQGVWEQCRCWSLGMVSRVSMPCHTSSTMPCHAMPCHAIPCLYFKSHFVQFSSVQTMPCHTPATGVPCHAFTDLSSRSTMPVPCRTMPVQVGSWALLGDWFVFGNLNEGCVGANETASPLGRQQRCAFSPTRSCCLVAAVQFRTLVLCAERASAASTASALVVSWVTGRCPSRLRPLDKS